MKIPPFISVLICVFLLCSLGMTNLSAQIPIKQSGFLEHKGDFKIGLFHNTVHDHFYGTGATLSAAYSNLEHMGLKLEFTNALNRNSSFNFNVSVSTGYYFSPLKSPNVHLFLDSYVGIDVTDYNTSNNYVEYEFWNATGFHLKLNQFPKSKLNPFYKTTLTSKVAYFSGTSNFLLGHGFKFAGSTRHEIGIKRYSVFFSASYTSDSDFIFQLGGIVNIGDFMGNKTVNQKKRLPE